MKSKINDILKLDESTLKELMDIDPSEIYKKQHDALKQHGLQILLHVYNWLEEDNHNAIRKTLNHSYAGDGNGNEKSFIDFEFSDNSEGDDIEDLLTKLTQIKDLATRTKIDRK